MQARSVYQRTTCLLNALSYLSGQSAIGDHWFLRVKFAVPQEKGPSYDVHRSVGSVSLWSKVARLMSRMLTAS